jgi:hypothetical protein
MKSLKYCVVELETLKTQKYFLLHIYELIVLRLNPRLTCMHYSMFHVQSSYQQRMLPCDSAANQIQKVLSQEPQIVFLQVVLFQLFQHRKPAMIF